MSILLHLLGEEGKCPFWPSENFALQMEVGMYSVLLYNGGSTCMLGWSQDHPHLLFILFFILSKIIIIITIIIIIICSMTTLTFKKCVYILTKKYIIYYINLF